MTPLNELIAYHQKREKDCAWEIVHCTELLRANNAFSEADCVRCQNVWAQERKIARDTVSYLKTLERRIT